MEDLVLRLHDIQVTKSGCSIQFSKAARCSMLAFGAGRQVWGVQIEERYHVACVY